MDVSEALLDTASLANRPLVILSNVAAVNLSEAAQQSLTTYVRDLGGGLLTLGGDQAFSAGGYAGSRLESLLPVYTDRDRLMTLSTALVLVIDRSGSMDGEKLAMAREAAVRTAQLLSSLDLLGVLSFEGMNQWVVPLARNSNKNAAIAKIKNISCGGGTNMYPALEEAYKALMGANANVRHMIVLTDGQSMPGDFEQIARQCAQSKVTISTVGLGSDLDTALLTMLAKTAKGRFYPVTDTQKLPRVFVRETAMITRTGLYEKPFAPTLRAGLDDEPTAGIDPATIPPLKGYVLTSARADATVAITRKTGGTGDPILAYWQVGLGRTTAFTSGMWNRWGPEWVSWSSFSKLWTQIVRWTARPASLKGWSVSSTLERGRVRLSAEADPELIANGRYPNLACKIVGPGGEISSLPLAPIGPGRFDGEFDAKKSGDYVVRLVDSSGKGAAFYTVVSVACPEELREVRSDEAPRSRHRPAHQRTRARRRPAAGRANRAGQSPDAHVLPHSRDAVHAGRGSVPDGRGCTAHLDRPGPNACVDEPVAQSVRKTQGRDDGCHDGRIEGRAPAGAGTQESIRHHAVGGVSLVGNAVALALKRNRREPSRPVLRPIDKRQAAGLGVARFSEIRARQIPQERHRPRRHTHDRPPAQKQAPRARAD